MVRCYDSILYGIAMYVWEWIRLCRTRGPCALRRRIARTRFPLGPSQGVSTVAESNNGNALCIKRTYLPKGLVYIL